MVVVGGREGKGSGEMLMQKWQIVILLGMPSVRYPYTR